MRCAIGSDDVGPLTEALLAELERRGIDTERFGALRRPRLSPRKRAPTRPTSGPSQRSSDNPILGGVRYIAAQLSGRNYLIKRLTAAAAGAALTALCLTPAFAQSTMSSPMPASSGSSMSTPAPAMGGSMGGSMHKGSMSGGMMSGPDHGMPEGKAGGDGVSFKGAPDLQAAISLVTAGGAPGHFSLVKALTALAGATTANAEVAKLTKQYGAAKVGSFVAVQNFAVNDAVAIATKAGVKFPSPTLHGKTLAVRVVTLGLVDGTYYEGVQLDHLVTNKIHEAVMGHIDGKFGAAADANYHRIADQAHYDLAQALGAKTVKLAAFH